MANNMACLLSLVGCCNSRVVAQELRMRNISLMIHAMC